MSEATSPSPGARRPPVLLRMAAALGLVLAFASFLLPSTWRPGMDFTWRRNEARCLLSGVDPYEVCFLDRESESFCSVFHPVRGKAPVNAYTPWEYTWILPLAALPARVGHGVFMALNLAALALIVYLVRRRACRLGFSPDRAWAAAAAACLLGLALPRVLQVSNYGLLMAAALVALAEVPSAGVPALCILMIKPQIGLPFVLPLLLARRWRTVAAAVAVCAVSALPPALLCGGNPIRMVVRVLFSGTSSIRASETLGSGLLPSLLVERLQSIAPPSVWLALSAAAGAALLAWGSWRLRRHPDAAVRFLPACAVALLWLPGHFHDRVLLALPLAVFATEALRGDRPSLRLYLLFTAEFWLCLVAGVVMPFLGLSPMDIVHNPSARAVYEIALCLAGWIQIFALCRIPRSVQ